MPTTIVSAVPSSILQRQFYGPIVPTEKPGRDIISHHLNQSISIIDDRKKIEADDEKALFEQCKEQIHEHIERRTIFFWHQLLACFGTRLHFEVGFTMEQAQSATPLEVTYADDTSEKITRNASHSSTFPCLFACPADEWQLYEDGKALKPQMFVFLKGSDLYKMSNATMDLLRAINEADMKLDGTQHNSDFSKFALELLNQASQGTKTPEGALYLFVGKAIEMIKNLLKNTEMKSGISTALKMYLTNFTEIKKTLTSNPDWIYQQLEVSSLNDKSAKMKSMVLRIRSKSIRDNLLGQSQLTTMIDSEKTHIFKALPSKSRPVGIEDAFRHVLIDSMPTPADQLRLRKFFAIPGITYNLRIRARQTHIDNAKTLLEPHSKVIKELAKNVSKHMYSMRVHEEQQRGEILRSLRFAKQWTQENFGKRLKQKFPEEPSSQTTISNCETGVKPISIRLAHKLSAIFDVPTGLLLPQYFNT